MKVVKPLDAFGREIKVGDIVVYATYTREAGLQIGEVVEIVPYIKNLSLPNPAYDRNKPSNQANPRRIFVDEQHFKIKFRRKSHTYDYNVKGYVEVMKTQTLDDPARFAIVRDLVDSPLPEDARLELARAGSALVFAGEM